MTHLSSAPRTWAMTRVALPSFALPNPTASRVRTRTRAARASPPFQLLGGLRALILLILTGLAAGMLDPRLSEQRRERQQEQQQRQHLQPSQQ